jgi:hypothetical protein
MKAARMAMGMAVLTAAHVAGAAPITPGNLLVYRVDGNGASLGSDAAIVRIDEYALDGTLVQTITLPYTGSGNLLTGSGTATSEGKITVSPNGRWVGVAGYNAAENTPSVATASGIQRTIARIDTTDGSYDVSTSGPLNTGYNNARAAVFDDSGTLIWAALHGSGSSYGVMHLTLGQTTLGTMLTSSGINTRGVRIFGGQLYEWGDATGNSGIFAVGSGLPTSGPVTLNGLPGLSGDTNLDSYGFFMADLDSSVPGYDTLWVARDTTGVSKYSLVSGTWTLNGTIDPGTVYHIDGLVRSGNAVTIAIVEGGGANNRVMLFDDLTGYNGSFSGSFIELVSAGSNNRFSGLVFAVPEPNVLALGGLGMLIVAVVRRRVCSA